MSQNKNNISKKKGGVTKKRADKNPVDKNKSGNSLEDNNPVKSLTASSRAVGRILLSQAYDSLPEYVKNSESGLETVVALFHDLKPKDQLEALLVTQMISVHFTSLMMAERCMVKNQPHDVVNANVNRMAKLMGVFTRQVEALEKYRGGGKQTIQVQHVHVSDNAQAVVGDVRVGGGDG